MCRRLFIESDSKEHPDPVLTWPDKRLSVEVCVPDMHVAETFEPPGGPSGGHTSCQTSMSPADAGLLHGDNRATLAWLLDNGYQGQVKLIYLDPPYDSGSAWTSRIRLRGSGATIGQHVQYEDCWQPGRYLQFMAERLLLLRELLHPDGVLWLHCDHRRQASLLLLLQEIFGAECHLNTIAWRSQVARGAKVHARYFANSIHFLHVFARDANGNPTWNAPRREIELTREEAASQYMEDAGGFFRTSHPGTYSFEKLVELHEDGRVYAPYNGEVMVDRENQRVYGSNGGNIGIKYYVEQRGADEFIVTRAVDNLWDDIPGLGTIPSEDVNYPTQKTEGLLQRIIEASTDPGDLVLDPFIGSGTTAVVAQQLQRRWIGCDANGRAVRTSAERLWRVAAAGVERPFGRAQGKPEGWKVGRSCGGADGRDRVVRIFQIEGCSRVDKDARCGVELDLHIAWRDEGPALVVKGFNEPALANLIKESGATLDDWRALVSSIAIDPDFEGNLFRARIVDCPQGPAATVAGVYPLPHTGFGRIAVRLVDIRGREHRRTLDTAQNEML